MTSDTDFRRVAACRICDSTDLIPVLSLGDMPLANAFIAPERVGQRERRYPLEVERCARCGLVQLGVVVVPEILFSSYLYASSASPPLLTHFGGLAEEITRRYAPPGSLVVEIGSNDGVLLRALKQRGASAIGVEPATNIARRANDAGLETLNEFFSAEVAERLRSERGPAQVVVGTNVLAHIDDLGGMMAAVADLLDVDGVFIAEVPYLIDLLDRVEYDTVYHEHLSYFHLAPLARLAARAGMQLMDATRLDIHGGSVRISIGHARRGSETPALSALLADEARLKEDGTYRIFAERVRESRAALRGMVAEFRRAGRRLAGLGATAKGNTLLNYCELKRDEVEFIADSTPLKHGLLTPGTHIPVRPESALYEERPDYALLLAWNYADAVLGRHAEYVAGGGRFIHPIPVARLLPA